MHVIGYYRHDGNILTVADLRRDEEAHLSYAHERVNATFLAPQYVNRFAAPPEFNVETEAGQLFFRENFNDQHVLSNTELIVIPVMLVHHFAMAIWNGGSEILYFDSLGWALLDGTRNGRPVPNTPNISRDLIHAVKSILGDEAPDELTVRVFRLEEGEHNPQNDLLLGSHCQYNCGLYALLTLEAFLFQYRDCFIQGLDIIRERERVTQMLRALSQRRHFT